MGFLLGGLLEGLGQAAGDYSTRVREDALIKLKRQQTLEDTAAADAKDLAKEGRDNVTKVGLLSLANQYKRDENESDFQYKRRLEILKGTLTEGQDAKKFKYDAALAKIRGEIDTQKDAASIRLKGEIDQGQVDSIHAAEDGSTVVVYKDGRTVVNNSVKLRASSADSGSDDPAAAIRAARRGTPPAAPKGVASAAPKVDAMTMTQEDVAQTATEMNMTPAQALIILKARGYRLAK